MRVFIALFVVLPAWGQSGPDIAIDLHRQRGVVMSGTAEDFEAHSQAWKNFREIFPRSRGPVPLDALLKRFKDNNRRIAKGLDAEIQLSNRARRAHAPATCPHCQKPRSQRPGQLLEDRKAAKDTLRAQMARTLTSLHENRIIVQAIHRTDRLDFRPQLESGPVLLKRVLSSVNAYFDLPEKLSRFHAADKALELLRESKGEAQTKSLLRDPEYRALVAHAGAEIEAQGEPLRSADQLEKDLTRSRRTLRPGPIEPLEELSRRVSPDRHNPLVVFEELAKLKMYVASERSKEETQATPSAKAQLRYLEENHFREFETEFPEIVDLYLDAVRRFAHVPSFAQDPRILRRVRHQEPNLTVTCKNCGEKVRAPGVLGY